MKSGSRWTNFSNESLPTESIMDIKVNNEIKLDAGINGNPYRHPARYGRRIGMPGRSPSRSASRYAGDQAVQDAPAIDRIAFVVPAYNEAGGIADLVAEINAAGNALAIDFEIVVVNDGSSDATEAVLESLRGRNPMLTVIHQENNCGQSAALHTGIEAARSEWVVTLDGDGQNVPGDARRLIHALQGCDHAGAVGMVVGRRQVRRDNWIKRISSRIANRVRSRLLGDGVSDTGCGLKLIRRDLFLQFPGFDHMHRFLPALARMHGRAVIEVDVGHRPRQTGTSKYGTLDRLSAGIVDLAGVLWLKHRLLADRTASGSDPSISR